MWHLDWMEGMHLERCGIWTGGDAFYLDWLPVRLSMLACLCGCLLAVRYRDLCSMGGDQCHNCYNKNNTAFSFIG